MKRWNFLGLLFIFIGLPIYKAIAANFWQSDGYIIELVDLCFLISVVSLSLAII